jgi:hypothetical protein
MDDPAPVLWWLTFTAADRPLGAAVVPVPLPPYTQTVIDAQEIAYELGCSPGGTCTGVALPFSTGLAPGLLPETLAEV